MKKMGSGCKIVAAMFLAMQMNAWHMGKMSAQTPSRTNAKKHAAKPAKSTSKHVAQPKAHSGIAAPHEARTQKIGIQKIGAYRSKSRRGAAVVAGHTRSYSVAMPKPTVESVRLSSAFVASAQLRPMAQQLVLSRSVAAFNGVRAYADAHPGEAASASELAIGHAYTLDHRYGEAVEAFHQASLRGKALDDYADFLEAQADVQGGHPQSAAPLLTGFEERHPGSLFVPQAPILLANAYLAAGNPTAALNALQPLQNGPIGAQVDFRFVLAKAYQASGDAGNAAKLYRGIYLNDPLSPSAANANTQLNAMNLPLTVGERKLHADAMFNAKQYVEAQAEYRALEKNANELGQVDRDALQIYAAVCDLRLKRLSKADVEHLPVTGDDSAALKMYLKSELARNTGNTDEHDDLVKQMEESYPQSRWLEEALYSGGNMYLLKLDYERAIGEYSALVLHFPHSTYAPSAHWHAAWLSYRLRRYPDAARSMDEQITSYPAGTEVPGALYWRGRLYEDVEHDFSQALNYYKTLNAAYVNSYYAILARQRVAVIGERAAAQPSPVLASVRMLDDLQLTDVLPENDPHLIKARLLANAALNEYIRPEIQLSATAGQWGAFAEAEIYQSFGESTRAIQAMKRSKLPFFSLPVSAVPMAYWELIFPRPYWATLESNAKANGLDPYLVASLIRQESEFNSAAVSRANAYGLMQLLPSTGKSIAKKQGDKHFTTSELLDPTTNLELGTIDLKKSIDRYNGQIEYALASYNAGDSPVHTWIAKNDYKDIAEWVESIPYSETRDYVQGILRNRELYRAVYAGK